MMSRVYPSSSSVFCFVVLVTLVATFSSLGSDAAASIRGEDVKVTVPFDGDSSFPSFNYANYTQQVVRF